MQKDAKGDPDRRGAVDATGVGCTPRGRAAQGRYDTGVPPPQGRGEGIGHRLITPGAWRSADRGAPLPMGQALYSGKPR